jgi:CubicO group peptidase (beta-lactamase class C family)
MDPFTPAFDELVKQKLEKWHAPGIAISVVHTDNAWSKVCYPILLQQHIRLLTWRQGYGIAKQSATPATSSTLFYSASTTKAQLCAAWAIYINSNKNKNPNGSKKITWTTPLADIIRDDFVLQDSYATTAITIEDALSHRTGMSRHELSYGRDMCSTPQEIVRNLRYLPLCSPLRTSWKYCNIMYVTASYALEVAYGKPFADVMRESLWQPLGMNDTYAGLVEAKAAAEKSGAVLANGYAWDAFYSDHADGKYIDEGNMSLDEVSGAGAVISTAEDYVKWMQALLSGSGPLSPDMTKEIWTPRAVVPADEAESVYDSTMLYCLGWFKATYRGHEIIVHEGDCFGFGACVLLLPALNWGVTYFSNGSLSAMTLKGIVFNLIDDLIQTPEAERASDPLERRQVRSGRYTRQTR